jgi:dipeptidyl aminopeptidase/acylaminoacyl peptidase
MPRPITPDDLFAFKLPEDPQLSPDGTQVAYVVMQMDKETYEYRRAIWIAAVGGGAPRAFTSGHQDSQPRWSPDGKSLAFVRAPSGDTKPTSEEDLSHGVGKPQIFVIPVDGGEARQLTFMRHGAASPTWSPDSRTLLFVAATGEPDDSEADTAALQGKNLPRVRTITEMFYRLDGAGFIYDLRSHLFTISAAGGDPRQLTDGDWHDGAASWSPDGRRIAFTSDRSDQRWQWPAASIWVIAEGGGAPARLTDEALGCAAPTWSPDGSTIAFLASPRRQGSGHQDLYTVPAEPGGETRLRSGDFVPNCQDTCISDMRASHGDPHMFWSRENEIFFLASLRGTTHVYAARLTNDLPPRSITHGQSHVYGFSLDAAEATLAITVSDPVSPGEVYILPTRVAGESGDSDETDTKNQLTNINGDLLAEIELASPREFTFQGADGWELQGWVMRPAQSDPEQSLPAILEIHGGPSAMYGQTFFHEFQLLAAHGYAVVYSNPRGSTGYGRDFAAAVRLDWGGKDYEDIMAGLDAAIAAGGIDTERLGVAGGSYGGYMTNWIIGHTNRFKAAVTMRCVSNIASFFGTSDTGWWLAVDEIGATPWEDLDELMRHSPITYIANMQTPLLILHSDNDLRCPISQGEQLFIALKYLGRETRFVRFEGQSHDLSRSGHPRSRVIRLNEITSWFDQHLLVLARQA